MLDTHLGAICARRILPPRLQAQVPARWTFNCVLPLAAVLIFSGGECVTEWQLPIIIRLHFNKHT
jgi:hypothetical protein